MVLALSLLGNLAVILFCLVAVSLVLIVLLQKGRGGGLSSAFGGGAGAGSLLGTKTGDVLTWITVSLVLLFLVMGVLMGKLMRPSSSSDLASPVTSMPIDQATETTEEGAATVEETTEAATNEAAEAAEEATDTTEKTADEADKTAGEAEQM